MTTFERILERTNRKLRERFNTDIHSRQVEAVIESVAEVMDAQMEFLAKTMASEPNVSPSDVQGFADAVMRRWERG